MDGTAFGPCEGEVRDTAEVCGDGLDQDCDGNPDDGCACTPNSTASCYTGPAMNQGVGACVEGTQTCNAQGTSYGACTGDVLPTAEDCATAADENCNGREPMNGGIDDAAGCECLGAMTVTCYTGPAGTADVGQCKSGMKTCVGGHYPATCAGEVKPATESCTTVGDEDCNGLSCSEPKWLKTATDAGSQRGTDVAVDPNGNVYWVGSFQGAITLGGMNLVSAGGYDIFVSKWAPDGTLLWAKRVGASGDQEAVSLDADANAVYVMSRGAVDFGGGPKTGMTVAKLSGANGSHIWSRSCSADVFNGGSVSVDPSGNVFFGTTIFASANITCEGGTSQPTGGMRGVLAKYDSSGGHKFSKTFVPMTGSVALTALKTDPSGSVWLAGHAGELANGTFGCFAGSDTAIHLYLAKLDGNGACSYLKKFNGAGMARDINVDSVGSPTLVGDFTGTLDLTGTTLTATGAVGTMYVAKFGAAGNGLWSKAFGASGTNASSTARGVGIDANDDVVVGGSFTGTINLGTGALTSTSGTDGVVFKMAKANGATTWARNFTTAVAAQAVDAGGPLNLVFATGDYDSTLANFGALTATGADSIANAFLVRVDP
ncbi:MAG: MopE-related protein [Polyangiaceae bacterium]